MGLLARRTPVCAGRAVAVAGQRHAHSSAPLRPLPSVPTGRPVSAASGVRRRPRAASATLAVMTPRSPLAVVAALVLIVAACGPGGSSPAGSSPTSSPGGSAGGGACPTTPEPAGEPAGWDLASQRPSVIPQIIGSSACGPTRLMFSFLDAQNVPVAAPDRSVEVALFDLGADAAKPVLTGPATFIWAIEPTVGVYVFNADFPTAGAWGAEFKTAIGDAAPETIRMRFDVQPDLTVIAVGEKAPASDTPTLADVD